MIKALLLIVYAVPTWERIVEAQRGVLLVLLIHLLPLMLLASAGEFYGLTHWGKQRAEFGKPTLVASEAALRYQALKFGLGLAVVFLTAQIIKSIGQSFHGRHTYQQGFTLVAYAISPLFLMQPVSGLPLMPAWVVWAVGICLTASALYPGLPRVMLPDPPATLGLYFMSVLTLVGLTALVQFLAGKFLEHQIQLTAAVPAVVPHVK
jgi:hypothetical protein